MTILLALAGPVTGLPLVLFMYGAQRLTLSTVGLMQYLAPTIQFLLAVLAFGEPFSAVHLVTFACIWAGLALYSWDAIRVGAAARRRAPGSPWDEVVSATGPACGYPPDSPPVAIGSGQIPDMRKHDGRMVDYACLGDECDQ